MRAVNQRNNTKKYGKYRIDKPVAMLTFVPDYDTQINPFL